MTDNTVIKKIRIENNLTQRECAELTNVALRTWQHWETGDRKMSEMAWELFCIKINNKKEKK